MLDMSTIITIDFETEPIKRRPEYPPRPVGVAIKHGSAPGRYYAWGHPTNNNATERDAAWALEAALMSDQPLLFHNARFDVDVLETFFDLRVNWANVHDTEPLLFLRDPGAPTFSLKPSAEAILGEAPSERDELIAWLIEHQPVEGRRLGTARGANYAGAYVCLAPGDLAGRYAVGDVDRTYALFCRVFPEIVERGMLEAYERERRLWPVLLDMERRGVPVDLERLTSDVAVYDDALRRAELWIVQRLGGNSSLNIASGQQLAEALIAAGLAARESFPRTKSGQLSTTKTAIDAVVIDAQVAAMLRYHSALGKSLSTFLKPWLETATKSGGRIFTEWHSTRNSHSERVYGARTGRLSSTPNLQNASRAYADLFAEVPAPIELPPLPEVRAYLVAGDGRTLTDRDYSQHEIRVLAHFEDGRLADQYNEDPWTDLHEFAAGLLTKALRTREVTRKVAKTIGLGLIYGMGAGKLAEQLEISVNEARQLKDAYLNALPGIREIYTETKRRAAMQLPIRTWGSREYYCEPPKLNSAGGRMTFEYKMPNALIQGSSADITKEALIQFYNVKRESWHVLYLIHDELVVSVPAEDVDEAMRTLREAMENIDLDVPLLSEGKTGPTLQALRAYDKRGVRV